MKLNIQKLLLGATIQYSGVANPFSNLASNDLKTLQTAATSSGESSLIPDKLLEKLSEKGIPNDVNKFMQMLAKFEKQSDFGLGVNKSLLYSLRAYANLIIKQSEYLDAAEKRADENGALDEYAVDSKGYLYVNDSKGNIKKIHASEYNATLASKTGQVALTVGELLQLRKFNPEAVDNSSIVTTIGTNVGIEKINDYIQGIIKAVGTASNSSEAYVNLGELLGKQAAKRPTALQQEELRNLYSLVNQLGPEALFKISESNSSKNMNEAMAYIMSMLPNNMRTLLVARNVAMGGDYENSSKYAMNLIGMAAAAGNTTSISSKMDYEKTANAAASKSGDLNKNLGVLLQLVLGSLGKRDYQLISRKNPEYSMNLHGTGVGSLADFDNDIVGKVPLSVALLTSLAPLIDLNHVTMGDLKITSGMFDTILYAGGDVINIWAPVNTNGDIDLEGLKTFLEIQKIIKNNPQLTLLDKNLLLQQYGLDGQFDNLGNFHGGGNMAQFLVMTGLTSDEVIDPDLNMFADVLTDNQKDLELPQIERIYGQLNKGIKSKDGQYQFQKGWFNWSTDLVKAPIFMKLNNTAQIDVNTFSNRGPLVLTPSYQLSLSYDQMRLERLKQIVLPSTAALYE